MSGWEPATAVFLVGLAVLCGGVLAWHYVPRAARGTADWWARERGRCHCPRCLQAREVARLAEAGSRARHPSAQGR